MEAPEFPIFFNKQATCVVGPGDDVHMPRVSNLLDYEGELAIVIGERCRHVPEERAHEVIAGYTIANDVSVRDWQLRTPTMTMGKSFDTHGPLGPWIVTADELGDPHALQIRTWVNDELRQDGNTREMIFDCFEQVAHLSEAFTLEPGDVIATGTPAGIGAVRQPFPGGAAEGRRRRPHRDRGHRRAREHRVEEPEGFVVAEMRRRRRHGRADRRATRVPRRQARRRTGDAGAGRQAAPVASSTTSATATAADLDGGEAAQGEGRAAHRVGVALRPRPRAALSVRGVLGPGRDPDQGHRPPHGAIMQRIAAMPEPPEPQTDDALAAIDRVILAITVERVGPVNYIDGDGDGMTPPALGGSGGPGASSIPMRRQTSRS